MASLEDRLGKLKQDTQTRSLAERLNKARQPTPGIARGMARAAEQGATFGSSDEIAAGAASNVDVLANKPEGVSLFDHYMANLWRNPFEGEVYDRVVESERAQNRAFKTAHPVLATGAEIIGAIPTAIATGPANAAATLGGRVVRGGLTAAAQGGAYGFLSGEGGAGNRAKSAAKTAAIAGPIGAAAPAVGAGVRNIADRVVSGRNARALGTTRAAYNTMMRAGAADETLTGEGAQRLARGGPDAMLAEAGPNMRTLLDTAMQKSGRAATIARRAITDRATQAGRALRQTLDDVLGAPQGVTRTETALRRGTAAARNQTYTQAYSRPIDYSGQIGQNIEDIVKTRVPMSAIRAANNLMRVEGEKSRQILASIADDGSVVFREMPDVMQLDYITRGLQEVADKASGQGKLGGTTALGRAYGNLKGELRSLMREAVPEYATALETAADPISKRAALRLGQRALSARMARDEFAEEIANMSGAEKNYVIQGIRSQIDDAVSNVRRALTDGNMDAREAMQAVRILTTRASREKMEMLLGPQRANEMFNAIDESISAFELRAAVADNSRTFARLSMDDAIRSQTDEGILNALRGGEPVNAVRRATQVVGGRTAAGKERIADETYSAIVDALTTPRGPAALNQLQAMQAMQAQAGPTVERARLLAERAIQSNTGLLGPLLAK